MHMTLISGSHRANSQSLKVAHYTAAKIKEHKHSASVIDLGGNPLPLWDGTHGKEGSTNFQAWQPIQQELQKADGLVVIAPEWHGMVPAGLRNLFLYATANEIGHKPALIMGVSASRGGSYPVAELRSTTTKNNRMLYIPEHILIQFVGNVLTQTAPANPDDTYIRTRIDFALAQLFDYAEALQNVRSKQIPIPTDYPNGM